MGGIASAATIDLIETSTETTGKTVGGGITTAMVFGYNLNEWHFSWQKDSLVNQASINAEANAVNLQLGNVADIGKGNYAAVKFEAETPLTLSFDVSFGSAWGGDDSTFAADYHVNVYGFTADGTATLIGSWQDSVDRKTVKSYPTSTQTITLAVTGMEDYVSYGVVFDSKKTVAAAGGFGLLFSNVVVNDSSIPEPTTATLSLLALAGLAARRRRK